MDTTSEVQLITFGVGGGEGVVEVLERAGVSVDVDPPDAKTGPKILLFRDPFEANLRLLFKMWGSEGLDKPLGKLEGDTVGELLETHVSPSVVANRVSKFVDELGLRFHPPSVVQLRQQGAQIADIASEPVLLLRANAEPEVVSTELSAFVGVDVGAFESVDHDLVGPARRQHRQVAKAQLKARYVTSTITQRWVQVVFTTAMGERIRKRWERVDVPQYAVTWTAETFGREIDTPPVREGRKVFMAEGGFEHFSENRTNIAVSKFWYSDISDPADSWRAVEHREMIDANRAFLESGDTESVEDVGDFSPKNDVLVHDIRVFVRGMPLDKYSFFLGDNCIYVEESEAALDGLGSSPALPHPGEIHCTAISVWDDSASYERSIGIPDDSPLLLTNREQLRIPTCFSRHRPHSLDAEDFADARVRIEIEYSDIDSGYSPHKFIRIPYLDQYPDADKLILPDRPWYQAWDREIPLKVKGFAVYFSPKAAIEQELVNLAIYAVDEAGKPVPGKRLELPDQIVGGGQESLSVSPAFVAGEFEVQPGEYLSASGILASGTPSADCAIFVLVEIPAAKTDKVFTNPLFFSNGLANLDYLRNRYNADRIISRPTPAGVGALEGLAKSSLEPWKSKLGFVELPEDEGEYDNALAEAASVLFVD